MLFGRYISGKEVVKILYRTIDSELYLNYKFWPGSFQKRIALWDNQIPHIFPLFFVIFMRLWFRRKRNHLAKKSLSWTFVTLKMTGMCCKILIVSDWQWHSVRKKTRIFWWSCLLPSCLNEPFIVLGPVLRSSF